MMDDSEYLEAKRLAANKNLIKLGELLKNAQQDPLDPELIEFIQEVIDHYMLNVCRLGR